MAQTMTIDQAQAYLFEHEFGKLRAVINDPFYGRRNATICNGNTSVMVLSPKRRRRGYTLDWRWIEKIFAPAEPKNPTMKFKKEAAKAEFYNDFIEKCLMADPEKGPYQNGLTTGTSIDGKCITTKAVEKDFEYTGLMDRFWEAFRSGERWQSSRYRWRGYDLTLWTSTDSQGRSRAGLNMEYLNCGNGYYYELINEDKFIGVDID